MGDYQSPVSVSSSDNSNNCVEQVVNLETGERDPNFVYNEDNDKLLTKSESCKMFETIQKYHKENNVDFIKILKSILSSDEIKQLN